MLDKLVDSSMHYTELTSSLLLLKADGFEKEILYYIFRFPSGEFAKKIDSFLLKLMVFEKFMKEVIILSVTAYNEYKEETKCFESTLFHYQHW